MIKTFTQTDLIRYLYQETTAEETREIEAALHCDAELREQYYELFTLKGELNAAALQPSAETLNNILAIARRPLSGVADP
jgi:anti-sigma factor RsiW